MMFVKIVAVMFVVASVLKSDASSIKGVMKLGSSAAVVALIVAV